METITTAEQLGFYSDNEIIYQFDLTDEPDYYLIARKNKTLGTDVIQRVSEPIVQKLKHNRGNADEIRAVLLQNFINAEMRIINARFKG